MSLWFCTCDLPPSLGLEPFVWNHALAFASPCCECRVTSSLQHLRTAELEARMYSWSLAAGAQSSFLTPSVGSISLGVTVSISPQVFQDCYFAVLVGLSNWCPLLPLMYMVISCSPRLLDKGKTFLALIRIPLAPFILPTGGSAWKTRVRSTVRGITF